MNGLTLDEMIQAGATPEEAIKAAELFALLQPGLKINRKSGRVNTAYGTKTVLGLYRTIVACLDKEVQLNIDQSLDQ